MKSRIWRLAGVGLLCVSVSAQALADEPQNRGPEGGQRGEEHRGNNEGHGGNNQAHPQNAPQPNNQPRPQNNEIIRGENSRQFEHNGQNRPPQQPNVPSRPAQPAANLPIQGRPDTVQQTRSPGVVITRTSRSATITTSTGRRVVRAHIPMIVAGRVARTGTAMAGEQVRSTVPVR